MRLFGQVAGQVFAMSASMVLYIREGSQCWGGCTVFVQEVSHCCEGASSSSLHVFPARFIAHIAANRPWCKTSKTPPGDQ
jgi:hypothetical protein